MPSPDNNPTHDPNTDLADQIGQFYVDNLGFPPVAGRMLGHLATSEPRAQAINELAGSLGTSRSAITQAVTLLEGKGLVTRSRARGDRVDRITAVLDVSAFENDLDADGYEEQATLIQRAIENLPAEDQRRERLSEIADFYRFVGTRLPELKQEWQAQRAIRRQPTADQ